MDLDHDGYADLAVASSDDDGRGRVFVYRGGPSGPGDTADRVVSAPPEVDLFGIALANAGDVDGDGFDDLAVGAASTRTGRTLVYVFHGSSDLSLRRASVLEGPPNPASGFGEELLGASDWTGDGIDDLWVGAPRVAGGQVRLYRGDPAGLDDAASLVLSDADGVDARFGASLCSPGDVDGDGFSDLLIGARGGAFLHLGGRHGLDPIPGTTLRGDALFGLTVAAAGDVDGDGNDDVLIADGEAEMGTRFVQVFRGVATGLEIAPTLVLADPRGPRPTFGAVVSGGSDVNGDGIGDFLIVAPIEFNEAGTPVNAFPGAGFVYSGAGVAASPAPQARIAAGTSTLSWGQAATSVGDVDADGNADVFVTGRDARGLRVVLGFRVGRAGGDLSPTWTLSSPTGPRDLSFGRALTAGE